MATILLTALIIMVPGMLLLAVVFPKVGRGTALVLRPPVVSAGFVPCAEMTTSDRFAWPKPVTLSRLNKRQTEDLLDWLESNGRQHCELSCAEDETFTLKVEPNVA